MTDSDDLRIFCTCLSPENLMLLLTVDDGSMSVGP